jgi:predicted peptidase
LLRLKGSTCAPLGYSEYVPPDYFNQSALPLIIAFHGDGETGNGGATDLPKIDDTGLPREIKRDRWDIQRRFIVLAPQMTKAQRTSAQVRAFLEFAMDNYKVDRSRIYLTSLSGGGRPLYVYMHDFAGQDIAAVAPISSVFIASSSKMCGWKDVPMWLFHGAADTTVLPIHSVRAFNAQTKCHGAVAPRLTEYTGVGHDAWTGTYSLTALNAAVQEGTTPYSQSVYDWLLSHSR